MHPGLAVLQVMDARRFWFYVGGRLIIAAATLDVEFTAARAGEHKREAAAGRLESVQ